SGHPDDAFLQNATRQLQDQFGIVHITMQVVKVPFTVPCGASLPPSTPPRSASVHALGPAD
ncbi:MAG TPA: hypothetical protein VES36_03245, partial [Candidatus Limnocylindrales bacterium]|nr:hypothetical protein [Candidatus Limnocylindrales bacterium]